jgi:hypothetical protein
MKNFTAKQLKEAIIELYPRKDQSSVAAYRVAFDLLETKIGEEKMDAFLEAYGI